MVSSFRRGSAHPPTTTRVGSPSLAESSGLQGGWGWLHFRQQSPLSPQPEECLAPLSPPPLSMWRPRPQGSLCGAQAGHWPCPEPGRQPWPFTPAPPPAAPLPAFTHARSRTHVHTHTLTHTCTCTPTPACIPQTAQPSDRSPELSPESQVVWSKHVHSRLGWRKGQSVRALPHLGCSCVFMLVDVFKNTLTWQSKKSQLHPHLPHFLNHPNI